MILQQSLTDKAPRAYRTTVGFLTRVISHVYFQRRPLSESLSAYAANIRLLVGVYPQMRPQHNALAKTPSASIANVGFFSGVSAHVTLQGTFPRERLPTYVADLVFFPHLVSPHVYVVGSPRGEPRQAFGANVLALLKGRIVSDDMIIEAL